MNVYIYVLTLNVFMLYIVRVEYETKPVVDQ